MHQCVTDDAYQETSPRASRWLTLKAHMKGITGAPYWARCDALTVTDVSWLPYTEHRGVRAFELISSFQGQLRWGPMVVTARPERVLRQFGYIQSIPPPPVSASLSHDDIDDRWMHFAEHVLPAGELCLVPGQEVHILLICFIRYRLRNLLLLLPWFLPLFSHHPHQS